jgi:small subunit ribosomal protein S11
MSTTFTRRLLARATTLRSAIQPALPARATPSLTRALSSTPSNPDGKKIASSLFTRSASRAENAPGVDRPNPGGFAMANLSKVLGGDVADSEYGEETTIASLTRDLMSGRESSLPEEQEPYHFHVYSHKHNTHVTVTKPNRNPIISLSCGNIGFRKSRRKQYDAAYQLTVYVLERLYDAGWDRRIDRMEVVLRGFGQGREAATKVLLGTEGSKLRDKIVRVSDATRIKFGGTKSRNPRRI